MCPTHNSYLLKLWPCLTVSIWRFVFNSMNCALAKSEQSLIAVMLITPSISAPNSKRWLLSFVLNITHSSSCSFTGFFTSGNPSGLSEKNWDNIDRGSLQNTAPQVQNRGRSFTLKILNCLPQMYPLPFAYNWLDILLQWLPLMTYFGVFHSVLTPSASRLSYT